MTLNQGSIIKINREKEDEKMLLYTSLHYDVFPMLNSLLTPVSSRFMDTHQDFLSEPGCLHKIEGINWYNFISNIEVRTRATSTQEAVELFYRLRDFSNIFKTIVYFCMCNRALE